MFAKTPNLTFSVLLSLFLLAAASVSAQTGQSSTGAQKKITDEELDTHLALARSLAGGKKFEEALKEYLLVFDNSRDVPAWGGVRLSYVPSEIAAMGVSYRPAILALQSRRDEREKLVLAAKADFDVIHELTSLNEHLNEPERSIALFDKLKPMGPAYAEVRKVFLLLIWEQLVVVKRYNDLKDDIDDLAKQIAQQISEAAINNDFPTGSVTDSPMYQSYLRTSIIGDGGRVFETLLALGKAEKANKLAKWMLTFSSDGEMYAQLINNAINANRTDIASDLNERAMKALSRAEDLNLVREAAKRLPSAKQ
jgi:hypothetical protein